MGSIEETRWVRLCVEDDVPPLEGRWVDVEGFYVGVFNTEVEFFAVYDVCSHRGGPLSDGDIADAVVTCPLHARKTDLRTGKVLNDDLSRNLTFPVKVQDGSVYMDARALDGLSCAPTRGAGSAVREKISAPSSRSGRTSPEPTARPGPGSGKQAG